MQKQLPRYGTEPLRFKDKDYSIEYFFREGTKETILFVHGLGGAKENFWTACQSEALSAYTLIGFDNPGTGNSTYHDEALLNVDDLTAITALFIERLNLDNFILAGASMGGLTTLLYLQKKQRRNVIAYINIEGNLMPEDCMFSSKVVVHKEEHFKATVFPESIREMKRTGNAGYYIIANNLELNTNVTAYYHYSFQTVTYSASGDLLRQYLGLDIPRLFIYGEKNYALSYLPDLHDAGMKTAMVKDSDHFVFYDNPMELYKVIADFIGQ